jgi:hypothetical protein
MSRPLSEPARDGRSADATPDLTRQLRVLGGRYGAEKSWAQTADRSARTAPGRAAALQRFEHQVDPDGVLDPVERARRAQHAQRAHMAKLALASVKARAARRTGQRTTPGVAAEGARGTRGVSGGQQAEAATEDPSSGDR